MHTGFDHFSPNLVFILCIPNSSGDKHLMVETYRGCVNGFTHTYMSDGLFTWLRVKSKGMRAESKLMKPTLLLQTLMSCKSCVLNIKISWSRIIRIDQ